jgi:predicted metal-dependent phosphoesterase TrpH
VRADLHTHSSASDGTEPPVTVMARAVEAGLDVVALTDHDTTAGWGEAAVAARRVGITLVPGAEISSRTSGISVHLLSYLHDPAAPGLLEETERARDSREHRAQRIVERLGQDYPLTWDDVREQVRAGATIGRPHIADALVATGRFHSRDEVFESVLHDRSPYYVPYYAPDAVTAVRLVREAGGVPVFAHPFAHRRGPTVGEDVIEQMVDAGLVGLEVDHRDHDDAARARLREIADRLGLLTTGSSDYHGAGKPNRLGENTTDPEVVEELIAQGSGAAVVRP